MKAERAHRLEAAFGLAMDWTAEEPFASLARRGSAVLAVGQADLRLTWVSPMARRVLDLEPEALVGTSALDLVHPDDREAAAARYRDASVTVPTAPVGLRLRCRDGSWRYAELVFTNRLADPRVRGVVVSARPTAGSNLAAAHHGEDPFRWFASSAPIGILFVDANGNVTYVNDRYLEITGLERAAATGWCWLEVTHPDDREMVVESALGAAERDGETDLVLRALRPDGETVWLRSRSAGVLGPDGLSYGYTISVEDITAEVDALSTSQRLAEALETTSDLVVILDASGSIAYANDAVRGLLGVGDLSEIRVEDFERFYPQATRERQAGGILPALLRDGRWEGEVTALTPDGREVPLHLAAHAHLDADGDLDFVVVIGRDMSRSKAVESRLAKSEARFRALVQHSHDLLAVFDREGRYIYASPSHATIVGYEPDELIGKLATDLVHPEDLDHVMREFSARIEGDGDMTPVEYRHCHRDGGYRYIEGVANSLWDEPAVGGVIVNSRDVTDRRRAEAMVADQARLLEQTARGATVEETSTPVAELVERWLDGVHAAVLVLDEESGALRLVAAPSLPTTCAEALDGVEVPDDPQPVYESGPVVVASIARDTAAPDVAEVLVGHGYRSFWAKPVHDPSAHRLCGAIVALRHDEEEPGDGDRHVLELASSVAGISVERTRNEARLAHQATHDPLTGLPNRALVVDRIRDVVYRARPDLTTSAVMFLDLDLFKVLNDSLGHSAGDRLLVDLGARLRGALRPSDTVARFGGDEFVLVCEDLAGVDAARDLAHRVLELVRQPFDVDGSHVVVTVSIGVAMIQRGDDPGTLLRDADAAMYLGKDRGRNRVEMFSESLRERVVSRLDTERDLRRALGAGELVLHYQPAVTIFDSTVVGFEALVRWHHPSRGLLLPEEFVSLAEETGLIVPIGEWAREEACRQAVAWRDGHPDWGDFVIGVNLSARELADHDLADKVAAVLASTGIAPRLFTLEITESVLVDDKSLLVERALSDIRELGTSFALDDFGTGYSSLAHLKKLPPQTLKIDQSFVQGLPDDPEDEAIVASMISLAGTLGLFVVAEGVETKAQVERLAQLGCTIGQGNWWAPAMPPPDIERLIVEDRALLPPPRSLSAV